MTPETKEAIGRLKRFRDLTFPEYREGARTFKMHVHSQQARDDLTTLIAALEGRPIEEAPENEPILIHDPLYGCRFVVIARYWNGGWTDDRTPCVYAPTKWWPLPLSALPLPEVKE